MKPQEIRDLRESLGWSQSELSTKLGYTPPTIMKWEQALTRPPDMAIALLHQLKSQVDSKKEAKRAEFIEKLTAVAITGGIIAFMALVFKDD